MKYLTVQDILVLHALAIDKTGGAHGIGDIGLLHSAVERPKMRFGNKELYEGIFAKASTYFESIARNHLFLDGNKRTAVIATARFLFLNGFELVAANKEVETFTLRIVNERLTIKTIASWLKGHSKKRR